MKTGVARERSFEKKNNASNNGISIDEKTVETMRYITSGHIEDAKSSMMGVTNEGTAVDMLGDAGDAME
jgi:hypothetical protein